MPKRFIVSLSVHVVVDDPKVYTESQAEEFALKEAGILLMQPDRFVSSARYIREAR